MKYQVITTASSFSSKNIECWRRFHDKGNLNHREAGAATIALYTDGSNTRMWYKYGKRYRNCGPAVVRDDTDLQGRPYTYVEYWEGDVLKYYDKLKKNS